MASKAYYNIPWYVTIHIGVPLCQVYCNPPLRYPSMYLIITTATGAGAAVVWETLSSIVGSLSCGGEGGLVYLDFQIEMRQNQIKANSDSLLWSSSCVLLCYLISVLPYLFSFLIVGSYTILLSQLQHLAFIINLWQSVVFVCKMSLP